ncbi:MAG: ABC transporter permease [Firmicutes bacterium]|nr:ABC transporter permease [Bacillota bacterium]
MSGIAQELRASYAFVERNFYLVRRYLGWEVVFLVYTMVNTLTIGLIGVDSTGGTGGQPASALANERVLYLIIGALLWGFLSILFETVSEAVAWERWEGTIEYTFMAPIHRFTHLGGTCLFGIVYGVLRTVLVLVAVVFFFRLDLHQANLWAALAVLVLSSFSFMGMGLIAAVLPLMSPERGPQATHIVQALLLLVSGVYYGVSALPHWLQPLAALSPATYTLNAAREALLHGAGLAQVAPDLWRLVALGLVLIPMGLGAFAWGEHYALRTGKLKRNG